MCERNRHGFACIILDGGNESIKCLCIGFFIDIYNYHTFAVGSENYIVSRTACSLYCPSYGIFNTVYFKRGYYLIVLGSRKCGILVHGI